MSTKFYRRNSNSLGVLSPNDLYQHICLKLLENRQTIIHNYRGEAKVSTYMSAVIRNFALEFVRMQRRTVNTIPNTVAVADSDIPAQYLDLPTHKLYLKQEIKLLIGILLLFGSRRKKIEFVLRGYFRNTISREDVHVYLNKNVDEIEIENFLKDINNVSVKSDREVFEIYTRFLNFADKTENSVVAIRKWVYRTIAEFINLLNNGITQRSYSRETLGILFDYYFNSKTQSHHLKMENGESTENTYVSRRIGNSSGARAKLEGDT